MKSMKRRGALFVEYALLLAVCCILGLIFVNYAPQFGDSVEPIMKSTDNLLIKANDNTGNPQENPDFAKGELPKNQTVASVANGIKAEIWKSLSDQAARKGDFSIQNGQVYGNINNVTSMTWKADGTAVVTTDKGSFGGTVDFVNDSQFSNLQNNTGFAKGTEGALVFGSDGSVVQHNENKTMYSHFYVKGSDGNNQLVGSNIMPKNN